MKNAHSARLRRQTQRRELRSLKTLADFQVPIPLKCFHCEGTLKPETPIELLGKSAIAHCLSCGNMTPFEFEPTVGEA
jgi:hypothetical protein